MPNLERTDDRWQPPDTVLTPETERSWALLLELLGFAERFVLAALIAADGYPARLLHQRLLAEAPVQGWTVRSVVCQSETTPQEALRELLAPELRDVRSIVWFQATHPTTHEARWWQEVALRLNERREVLREGAMRVLVLVMPEAVKPTVREAASDLWSILQEALPVAAQPAHHTTTNKAEVALPATTQLGRLPRALHPPRDVDEAAAMVEQLRLKAAKKPNAFLPDLALALMALSQHLVLAGNHQRALDLASEAATLFRQLKHARAGAFDAHLANSLNTVGNLQNLLGQPELGITSMQEAVSTFRSLADGGTGFAEIFKFFLAASLSNLSNQQLQLGLHAQALGSVQEAISVSRWLAASLSDDFQPNLAKVLSNLGIVQYEAGLRDHASASHHEAIKVLRPFFLKSPTEHMHDMQTMVEAYLRHLDGQTPDQDLLGPVQQILTQTGGVRKAGSRSRS